MYHRHNQSVIKCLYQHAVKRARSLVTSLSDVRFVNYHWGNYLRRKDFNIYKVNATSANSLEPAGASASADATLNWFTLLDCQPRNMHTVFALLCFVVVIHWLIFPYPSGLLHWHCGNLTIAPVPAKQPWWIWINTSCEFIMNDCITTTKQSTTKPCAYFLGYTVPCYPQVNCKQVNLTLKMYLSTTIPGVALLLSKK